MLKNLVNKLRSKSPEPTVWHGRHSDIWPDPDATDYGWYCGWCGHNRSGFVSDPGAKYAAQGHASTHEGVTVAPWK